MIHCMYQSLESVPPTFWNGLSPLVSSVQSRTCTTVNIPNIGISQTFFFLATDLNPESSPDNLFDVLSLCNEVNHSWRAMRAHTVALRRPLFACCML